MLVHSRLEMVEGVDGVLINIVNPNSTDSMTDTIEAAARAVAAESTTIRAVTSANGPASIEGYYDEAMSVPGLLSEIEAGARAGADAHVIACFDDTGLDAARCIADAPVIGIGEAACHVASIVACSFSIVTTLRKSVPALRRNVIHYGFGELCASVRASGVEVLAIDEGGEAIAAIEREVEAAIRDDQAEAIVLGCAGMADLAASLERRHGVPVIDGVAAAVAMAQGLAMLGVSTSKIGGYAVPTVKSPGGRA